MTEKKGSDPMEMKQCPNGHFYDQSRTPECPYCNSESANINVTRPIDIGVTTPIIQPTVTDRTRYDAHTHPQDDERTVAVIHKKIGIDPVVGWLVCVNGSEKGRDYRVHADNNYIGRAEKMDICIRGDDTVSRENHAVISYDMQGRMFYFSPGEGRSIVRVNGNPIFSTVQLAPFDRIQIGNTTLMFAPFCGGGFNWE